MDFHKVSHLAGEIAVPGDKSVSHRAVMLGALASGTTEITNFLQGADCLSTIGCLRHMGVSVRQQDGRVLVDGVGLHGLRAPSQPLDVGNSGTTARLLSGILAGQPFRSCLTGDASIQRRPMKRIMDPLSQMGARVESQAGNGCLPLEITGGKLRGIHYQSPVASAQVKSCVLLAGLYGDSPTSVTEPSLSRDHSERMLSYFGADVRSEGTTATIAPAPALTAQKVQVPGDISSAAYFLAAGLIVPHAEILLRNVGVNPTRDGMLRVLEAMGASLEYVSRHQDGAEPAADILVRPSSLRGTVIEGSLIPSLIDEIPILAVLACFAQGRTVIRDAQELKVKESNRIETVTENLRAMGAHVQPTQDGMVIDGGYPLHGAALDSHMDHRIAMSFAVAALACEGTTSIKDAQCVDISYPSFYDDLKRLSR